MQAVDCYVLYTMPCAFQTSDSLHGQGVPSIGNFFQVFPRKVLVTDHLLCQELACPTHCWGWGSSLTTGQQLIHLGRPKGDVLPQAHQEHVGERAPVSLSSKVALSSASQRWLVPELGLCTGSTGGDEVPYKGQEITITVKPVKLGRQPLARREPRQWLIE